MISNPASPPSSFFADAFSSWIKKTQYSKNKSTRFFQFVRVGVRFHTQNIASSLHSQIEPNISTKRVPSFTEFSEWNRAVVPFWFFVDFFLSKASKPGKPFSLSVVLRPLHKFDRGVFSFFFAQNLRTFIAGHQNEKVVWGVEGGGGSACSEMRKLRTG